MPLSAAQPTPSLHTCPPEGPPSEPEVRNFLAALGPARRFMPLQGLEIAASEILAWLRAKEHLVGLAGIRRRRGIPFFHLAVEENYRGRGLGRALLERVLELGRERLWLVVLSVHRDNESASGLYRAAGFHTFAVGRELEWMARALRPPGRLLTRTLRVGRPVLSLIARHRERHPG